MAMFLFHLFQQNKEYFKVDSDSDVWELYVEYVDDMIVEGFVSTIYCSMNFLLDNTDPKNNIGPLFQAQLELEV